jgi:hypothetical protein
LKALQNKNTFECHNIYCLDDKEVEKFYAQALHSVLLHCKFYILDIQRKINAGNYKNVNKFHTQRRQHISGSANEKICKSPDYDGVKLTSHTSATAFIEMLKLFLHKYSPIFP